MPDVTAAPLEALVIRRTFNAAPQRIFDAWTRPELMREWIAPFDITVTEIAVDARVGGAYRIAMDQSGKPEWVVGGEFVEIDPPRRLALTWRGLSEINAGLDTLVTIDFHDRDGATEVVLTHTRFTNEQNRNGHTAGWDNAFAKLEAIL